MRFRIPWAVALLLTFVGCGGGADSGNNGSSGGSAITGITITPASTQVQPGGTRSFKYTIAGTGSPNQSVVWSVSPNGGAIDQTGFYTAPRTLITAQVTVTSMANPAKSATAQVQIAANAINLALTSASVGVVPGGSIDLSQFVTVTGTGNTGLNWSVYPSTATGGTVNAQGVFTSAVGASGGTIVLVSSQADPTIIDAITVSVISGTIAINPKTLPDTAGHSIHVGQALKFGYTINLSGSTNAAITWATTDANGNAITTDGATIDSSGNYRASSTPGTYYVTVRSVANPALKDTATLQVVP